jgi:hypothetical protein
MNVQTSAPFLEFSVDFTLQIPVTEIERNENIELTIAMIVWPLHRIVFNNARIARIYYPFHPRSARFYASFDTQCAPFAGIWEINVCGPLWLVPMRAPVPTFSLDDSPRLAILADSGQNVSEWGVNGRLVHTPACSHPFRTDRRHNDQVENRIIRYYEENGGRICWH